VRSLAWSQQSWALNKIFCNNDNNKFFFITTRYMCVLFLSNIGLSSCFACRDKHISWLDSCKSKACRRIRHCKLMKSSKNYHWITNDTEAHGDVAIQSNTRSIHTKCRDEQFDSMKTRWRLDTSSIHTARCRTAYEQQENNTNQHRILKKIMRKLAH